MLENAVLNADKGFDSKRFRRCCLRRKLAPNTKENIRNRKKNNPVAKSILTKKSMIEDLKRSVVLLGWIALEYYSMALMLLSEPGWRGCYLAFFLELIKV
ncbi:MAG: hypothetical protein QM530_09750 [Phycisphaerales bacterium]|nr:hypothetical protein [Phycisphaerales bacterium]